MTIKFTNNSAQVFSAFERQVERGLEAIGQTAEGHAKDDCPVDTGRLRNSITSATKSHQSATNNSSGAKAKPEDYKMKSSPERHSVYIGTNVDYAPSIEFKERNYTTGGAHFLRNAATQHSDEYEKIMEASLKDEML